ncbi:TetR/AcrR family transcriptional regulator [Paraburkholderia sp. C35]|uniref:TetR/AcrR family transcriptional regulator n=1 Tax=Paraburkholderia sp. C35 TaxID=2126993 RepID=UPI000D68F14D|nr:TetR/AcrR family transcriptional regulator [Paraburkholderia sp. C35]
MRKSKAEKAETRKHIVEVASQMFKSQGIGATGVGEIMVAAGLTHSAFYRHFESKDELVAEASTASISVFVEAAEAALAKGPDAFVKYLQDYLSSKYRDDEMGGCPVAQTGSELALADAPIRQGVSDALERLMEMALSLTDGSADAEAETIFTMSALVGAITVSRLINNPRLSEHIIDVVQRRVANQPAAPKKEPRAVSKTRRPLARA